MENNFFKIIKEITDILPYNKAYFESQGLLKFSDGEISTPAGNILSFLLSHKSYNYGKHY